MEARRYLAKLIPGVRRDQNFIQGVLPNLSNFFFEKFFHLHPLCYVATLRGGDISGNSFQECVGIRISFRGFSQT